MLRLFNQKADGEEELIDEVVVINAGGTASGRKQPEENLVRRGPFEMVLGKKKPAVEVRRSIFKWILIF